MPDIISWTSSAGKTKALFQPPDLLESGWCSLFEKYGPGSHTSWSISCYNLNRPKYRVNIYITSTYSYHMPYHTISQPASPSSQQPLRLIFFDVWCQDHMQCGRGHRGCWHAKSQVPGPCDSSKTLGIPWNPQKIWFKEHKETVSGHLLSVAALCVYRYIHTYICIYIYIYYVCVYT